MKKVGRSTRPFRYDLNQIPCDYTVEVTNRFKGLDLIEGLMNYGWRFMTLCSHIHNWVLSRNTLNNRKKDEKHIPFPVEEIDA